jgi:hypothetical protein
LPELVPLPARAAWASNAIEDNATPPKVMSAAAKKRVMRRDIECSLANNCQKIQKKHGNLQSPNTYYNLNLTES